MLIPILVVRDVAFPRAFWRFTWPEPPMLCGALSCI
jgi:hypothetical protein